MSGGWPLLGVSVEDFMDEIEEVLVVHQVAVEEDMGVDDLVEQLGGCFVQE